MYEGIVVTWQLFDPWAVIARQRPKGEMNGKSGNLNNAISQIYPEGVPIPGNEVLAIFDADQVPSACTTHHLPLLLLTCSQYPVLCYWHILYPGGEHALSLEGTVGRHLKVPIWLWPDFCSEVQRIHLQCQGSNPTSHAQWLAAWIFVGRWRSRPSI